MICQHELGSRTGSRPNAGREGCDECLRLGTPWVHLRLCLSCGHVGCCDSSPGRHATKHAHHTDHPVAASFEPGEVWAVLRRSDDGGRAGAGAAVLAGLRQARPEGGAEMTDHD